MHRTGLALLILGFLAVASAYACALFGIAAAAAPWWLASGTTGALAGIAVLGAARRRRPTPVLAVTVALSFASVLVGLLLPLLLPAPDAASSLLLGLPRPTAILLLLVGLVPLVLLPLAYAYAFDREVLTDADLDVLRGARARAATERGE